MPVQLEFQAYIPVPSLLKPHFPEQHYRTHGDTYEEAAQNGREVLELLLQEDGLPIPKPQLAYS